MPGHTNYFLGRDVCRSYELYGRVRARGVYRGIDMVFHGNQERLEYDFEIAAGREPGKIRLHFEGADEIRIDPSGDLILRAGAFEIHEPAPVAYQYVAGRRTPITVAYQLDASNQVRFHVGPYDRTHALVIDPQLVFDKSFGGSGTSSTADVALDAQGNIYVAGQTNSTDFPLQNATQNHPGGAPLLVSADGGQTFTAPVLGLAASSVRSVAFAPTNPSVVYAASNAGVTKSVDGGTTWTTPANVGLTVPPIAIAVDAGSATTVYAASHDRGIFTSTDAGASWNLSTNGLIVPGSIPPSAPDLSGLYANPTQPGTVFAIAQSPDFVYRSTDFGQSWTRVNVPLGGAPIVLVFSPADPNTLFIGQQIGPFLKSTDDGDTWASVSSQTFVGTQGLAISSGNPQILFATGRNALVRSSDGGQTWTSVLPLNSGAVAVDPRNGSVAYAVDSSGLYRSADTGLTWNKA
ncbi:MAG TPA: SBBP repeat-containing protein, partial [Bryobacteraceae bacterium]|nr:SBBP repeat-containing protein [Bryobacteraceae bacterium]